MPGLGPEPADLPATWPLGSSAAAAIILRRSPWVYGPEGGWREPGIISKRRAIVIRSIYRVRGTVEASERKCKPVGFVRTSLTARGPLNRGYLGPSRSITLSLRLSLSESFAREQARPPSRPRQGSSQGSQVPARRGPKAAPGRRT